MNLQKQYDKLNAEKRALLKDLHAEKKASNKIINDAMSEARVTMSEAVKLIEETNEMKSGADTAKSNAKLLHYDSIRAEQVLLQEKSLKHSLKQSR